LSAGGVNYAEEVVVVEMPSQLISVFLIPTARNYRLLCLLYASSGSSTRQYRTDHLHKLDGLDNQWHFPDMEDALILKVKSIQILPIVGMPDHQPGHPTGYGLSKRGWLEGFVKNCGEFNLLLICRWSIKTSLTMASTCCPNFLKVIGKSPGRFPLKGFHKNSLWPGARCGWMEFYKFRESSLSFLNFARHLKMQNDRKFVRRFYPNWPSKNHDSSRISMRL